MRTRTDRPSREPRRPQPEGRLPIEQWKDADKVLIASALTLPFALGWVARMLTIGADASASPYVSREFLPVITAFTIAQASGHLALVIAALIVRRSPAHHAPWLAHAEAQWWFACASFSLWALGPFTSPYLVLVLALPVIGTLLFEWPVVRAGMVTGAIGVALAVSLPIAGVLPYAPFLREAPFANGQLHPAWVMAVGLPSLFVSLVVLLVFGTLMGRLRRRQKELERLSSTDPLTGLANRTTLFARLDEEHARARRHGQALSLLMLDVDHFKAINDQHGHLAGDEVLRRLAEGVRSGLRLDDVAARYGGEELSLVLPHTTLEGASVVAERLLAMARTIPVGAGSSSTITVSIGIAQLAAGEPVDALVARADDALYEAKREGRDRVVVALDDEAPHEATG